MVSAVLLPPFPQRRFSFKNLPETTSRRDRLCSPPLYRVYAWKQWIEFIQLHSTVKITRNLISAFFFFFGWGVLLSFLLQNEYFYFHEIHTHDLRKGHTRTSQNILTTLGKIHFKYNYILNITTNPKWDQESLISSMAFISQLFSHIYVRSHLRESWTLLRHSYSPK